MKSKTSLLLVLAALAATASTSHAVVYSIDDGTAGAFVGVTNGTLTFANGFTAVAGGEVIQSIEIAWGLVANGTSFTARLWSDPNGDGSPSDAVELTSLSSTVSLANTNTFVLYNIPDVQLLPGDKFFVGGTITHASGEAPGAFDSGVPGTAQSWAQEGPDFTDSPANASTTFGIGDQLVRANGGPAAVPEGGATALLLGLSLCGLAAARKRLGSRGI